MLKARLPGPAGLTLIELTISLSLAGVVLAMFAALSARQQRVYADMSDRASLAGQLRAAAAIVPIDLRALSPSAGDVREARDTAIELRATIASAVVCDTSLATVTLAPAGVATARSTFASYSIAADVGDTVWVLSPADSADAWPPYRVTAVSSAAGGACARGGPLADSSASATRVRLTLDHNAPSPIGMPARITRPVRYSLYRASDNQWYLGERDWSAANARFNTIQPVAGPFLPPSAGGLAFTYADSNGTILSTPVVSTRAIALVGVQLVGQTRSVTRALGAQVAGAAGMARRGDTVAVAIALRNRR